MTRISLRQLQPDDGDALRGLFTLSPDDGRFAIAPQYQIDPYQIFVELGSNTTGVIAELPRTGEVVGVGLVDIQERYLAGAISPCAFLHSLTVHPSYRRQGIATQLAKWRIDYARRQIGEDVPILALIQKGNTGSMAAAQKWEAQTIGHCHNSLIRIRATPPDVPMGLTVRTAKDIELEQIADSLNSFYQDYNLYIPQSRQSLAEWLQKSPFVHPFRSYYVVVDEQENILAGLAVAEQYRVVTMHVQRMPGMVKLLNHIVKMVPPDGVLRQLSINKIWFAPGRDAAARYLWEYVRWQMRDVGSHLVCSYDPLSPISAIIDPPFWLPKGTSVVVAHSSLVLDDRLVGYA